MFDRVMEAAARPRGGVELIDIPPLNPWTRQILKLRLDQHGYVMHEPAPERPVDGTGLVHRHVALVVTRETPIETAAWAVRRLAEVSPRRHLVIRAGPVASPPATETARQDWRRHVADAVRAADRGIERAEIRRVAEWLTSVAVEAALRGTGVPEDAVARMAEVAFWLGERPDVARVTPRGDSIAAAGGWLALFAWCTGSASATAGYRARIAVRARLGDPRAKFWDAVLGALVRGNGDARKIALLADAAGARATERMVAMAVTGRQPCPDNPLSRILNERLTAHAAWRARISGPTDGRTHMQSLDGVCALLQRMEDAPDESAALAAGCAWLRTQGESVRVAITSADGQRLVAGQGWRAADLSGEIAAILSGPAGDLRQPGADRAAPDFGISIRYGGATIGSVVVHGRATDRDVLAASALALAAVSASAVRARLDALAARDAEGECAPEILGRSPAVIDLRASLARVAPTSFPVLIEGESGTGKELAARAIHRLSPRREHRLVCVNCAALTDELIEAELFGHSRGAFTGAIGARAGLFEEAHGGTIFLDEVSELSPRGQAKLLRVLQEREIRRVGENTSRRVDVRVVAATNLSLAEAVAAGRFRDDLRFRLAVVRLRLTPLRDRIEDLPLLAHVFWRRALAETGKRAVLGPDALATLMRHGWPGNVRELQNVIAGLAVAAPGRGRVTDRHVRQVISHITNDEPPVPLETARRGFERRVVTAALARHAGRRSRAARELGLTRQGLAKVMRRLGLQARDDAAGVA
jgi:two-component system response regulator HydG